MKKLSFKAEEIDNRLYNVEILEKLTAALQLSIDQATKNAATAQNAAKTAEATAKTAEATAKTARSTANVAKNTANTATATANAASETAATAKATADVATTTAGVAQEAANAAQATANTAVSTANTAQSTADTAISTANTAKATANAASETAATAKSTADTAKATADTAKSTADTAKSTADTAGMTAESAKLTADTAKATADTAKETAETAQSAAATAQSAAEAAQAAAEAAQGAADTAQATADLAATAADLTALQAEVTNLSAQVSTNTADVAQHTSDVAKLTADIATNTADIAQATADVASLGADVTELQAQMTGEVKDFMDEVTLILEGDGVDTSGLQDNLDRIEKIATEADEKAVEARGKADNAQTDATQGINDAAAAQKSADDAQASATAANNAAATAQTKAEEAWTHADNARQAAENAQTSATNATTAAGVAQSKADEAFSHAQDALTASEAAATNANNAAISAAGAEAKANEASIAAEDASKAADEAKELANKAETKATEAEGHASAATAQAELAQQEAAAASSSAANAASSASEAAENATKAQGFADDAAQLAEQANTKAQEANTHAENALGQAAIAQEEAGKAQKEAEDAQAFATEAEEAAKEARAAADLAQLTADNKNSTFKGTTDPVDLYNNAVIAYLADKTSANLEIIPAYPKVGDLWYEPTGEDTPDKVWQLSTAYLDIAEEVKDENDNIINVLYLIYKDADFNELGGIWTDVMVNTVTTGFVNALGVTAQKIEVKDSSNNLLFKADASDDATNKVIIGGFGVKNNAIHSGMIDSMNAVLAEGATGVYLGTDGLRVGNKFKVTPDGTVYSSEFKLSQEEIDKLALKVKYILYAKNDSGTVPPENKENNWTDTIPEAEAGEYIWTKYVYQDLDEDDSNNQYSYQVYRQPENGAPGKDGQDGANGKDGQDGSDGLTPYIKDGYWWLGDTNTGVMAEPISYSISKNMEFHNGSEQATDLIFTAKKQIGQNNPEADTDVYFRHKFTNDSNYSTHTKVDEEGKYIITISDFTNKNRQDLTVSIGHLDNGNFVEDDVEIINYISKSGFAVILDNDAASLIYNSDGTVKLDNAQSVTATASLYENNELVNYSTSTNLYYEWTLDGLTGNISSTRLAGNNDTITITAIDTDKDFGTATCIAVWEDAPQEHKAVTFKVTKNRQGIQGIQGIQGETGSKGDKGDKGDKGADGTSISSVVEYYLATSLSTGVTTSTSGWTDTVQNVDATKKYLWNYEVIKDSKGNIINSTTPCIIGAYGDKGSQGNAGKGILSITNYYLVSANPTGIVNTAGDWKTTPQTTSTTNKYLWNYELITYTDGATTKTTPCIIGTHGETGAAGKDGSDGKDGNNGISPEIKNGYWYIGTTNTGIKAEGKDGAPGANGSNGLTPYISGGYWWIGDTNTGIKAEGVDGADGTSAGNLYKLENTGNAPSKPTSISASGWTKAPQEPTPEKNYCWVSAYTISANGTFTAETPILHASYEGMISFLSDGGLKLIAKDSSTGEYYVKTDHIHGALSDKVTVGGFIINDSYITSDARITVLGNEHYDGVYIGTNGISLGKGKFVVNSSGDVTIAGNVTIGQIEDRISAVENDTSAAWSQANSAQNAADDAQSTADSAQSTANNAQTKATTNAQSIVTINGNISALQGDFNTLNTKVANLGNATAKSLKVGFSEGEGYKFMADSNSNEVTIGGFNVNNQSLYSSGYITSYSTTPTTNGIYMGKDGIKLGTKFSVSNAGSIKAESGTIGGLTLSDSSIASDNGNFSVSSAGDIDAKSGNIGGFTIGTESITSTYSGNTYGMFANGTTYGSSCFQKDGGRVYGTGMIRTRTISLGHKSSNYTGYTTGFVNGALQVATNNVDSYSTDPQVSIIEPWQLEKLVSIAAGGGGALIATNTNISIAKDSQWTMPRSTYNLTGTTILYAGMTPKADNNNAYARTCHVAWDDTNIYFYNTGDEALAFTCFVIGQKSKTNL